ncbi:MAG: hypothetical protein K2K81_01725 [Muribaculaceae bacterium]|nr:hypothetical protein [Muribaculaceae bacterium]
MSELVKMDRRYYNSAIGSWAGFIYQAWWAIYVVLHHTYKALSKNKEDRSFLKFKVYLDSYEDFSIHDESNKAVSLHQCKIYKSGSFDEAFKQMVENKKHLEDANLCNKDATMFFHCNKEQDIPEVYGIKSYEDHENKKSRNSKEVLEGIDSLVDSILVLKENKNLPSSAKAAIIQFFEEKVTEIQKKYHNSKKQLREIARGEESAITFEEIWKLLTTDPMEACSKTHLDRLIAYHFLENLAMKVEEYESENLWEDLLPDMVNVMGANFTSMTKEKISEVLCRIYPDTNIHSGTKRLIEIANRKRIADLIDLIGEANQMTLKGIEWQINKKYVSPAVFEDTKISRRIWALRKNGANLDMLWEYDWLLALNITESVPNIAEHSHYITDIDDTESDRSIFSKKRIGLLSIEDFNKGNV